MGRASKEEQLAILERRKNVARRYLRGEPQHEIARSFEVDAGTISRDLKALREEWKASALADTTEFKALQLAKLDEVERNAWLAWTKSQENAEALKVRSRGKKVDGTEKVTKGQAGDPRFLAIVLECVEKLAARSLALLASRQSPMRKRPRRTSVSPSVSPSLLPSLDCAGFVVVPPVEMLGRFSRGQPTLLDRIALDPTVIFTRAEMTPDPWQERLLHSTSNRILELCSRQAGKSVVAAAKALQVILLNDEALVLIRRRRRSRARSSSRPSSCVCGTPSAGPWP